MKKDHRLLARHPRIHQALISLLIAAPLALIPRLFAQSDNFDSGTDSGWVRVNVLSDFGGPNAYSFPDSPFGKSYRIQCTSSSALLAACGNCGTARPI